MEENNKGKSGLLIVFIVVSVLLASYIVYDKVLNKSKETSTIEEKETTNSNEKETKQEIKYTEIFKDYKDADGTYGSYYMTTMEDTEGRHAYAKMQMDGKIELKVDQSKNKDGWYILSNINDATEIMFNNGLGKGDLYILCKNGDVYKYSIDDYEKKSKTASKVENLNNIIKLVLIDTCGEYECSTDIGAIDKDMNYKKIDLVY